MMTGSSKMSCVIGQQSASSNSASRASARAARASASWTSARATKSSLSSISRSLAVDDADVGTEEDAGEEDVACWRSAIWRRIRDISACMSMMIVMISGWAAGA